MKSSKNIRIRKFNSSVSEICEDVIAVEEPLEIMLAYGGSDRRISKIVSITMRTPGNDDELASGFLFTEGIIQDNDQISEIIKDEDNENRIKIFLKEDAEPFLQNAERNFYTSSSCGVCGKSGIESIRTVSVFKNLENRIIMKPDILYSLNGALKNQQTVFQTTGGLHASALFDPAGKLIILREDVGRHNALDKVIGYAFRNSMLPLNNFILLLSGRASFELIQKSEMAGIKTVAAVGAPSSLAVEMAVEAGITLIGFLNKDRFNVYSGELKIEGQND